MFSIVTGGAGFIGSHTVDVLAGRGDEVVVIDNLSAGSTDNIAEHLKSGTVRLVQADLLDDGWQAILDGADRVYHIAADPDVRGSAQAPGGQVQNNIVATQRVLDAMREHSVPELVFTSTSTVYGEAKTIPTPEHYTPMYPISVYGASKLACEALISAYAHSFSMQAWIFRFANIIGERSGHGVITDFIRKLRENPKELEILGDGRQTKSYLDVRECVGGFEYAVAHADETVNTFNIGSEDWIDVVSIADIIVEEMGLSDVAYRFTGGARGWVGDVPRMQLSVDAMKGLGWTPALGSEESVRTTVRAILQG
ncbi:NAD-dependent epimerase/dehydratase family protein [Methanofollis fontis]|uniref:UDP-glucose 4-epimerase n=1 Tax=Methanofollis fontis TaxID=2052832 RepID=A0A483CNN8_9EURY|nr:NAD-dependent epimerase/dehydratase family protein [Methanofollis fontis]TAJ44222.1 UDP-glucose 4-epimerase [Methanofollis fontis]